MKKRIREKGLYCKKTVQDSFYQGLILALDGAMVHIIVLLLLLLYIVFMCCV